MAVNKIFKVFLKATDVIALCFLIPLFIGSLFVSRAVDFETIAEVTLETRKNPIVSAVFALIILFALIVIISNFRKIETSGQWKLAYAVIGLCCIAIAIGGAWWITANPHTPKADQLRVWTAAVELAQGNGAINTEMSYFWEYPQQKNMAVIMSIAAKLCGCSIEAYSVLNLLFIIGTVIVISLCVKTASNRPDMTMIVAVLLTAFIPMTLYSRFMYGSVAAVFFTALSAYGITVYFAREKLSMLIMPILLIPVSVMLYQGELIFLISASMVLIIGIMLKGKNKRDLLVCFLSIIVILALTFILTIATDSIFNRKLGVVENGGDGIPASCHILMGLQDEEGNMPGNYNGYSRNVYHELNGDTAEVDRQARAQIRENINQFTSGQRSPIFFLKKTNSQWLDPWFGGLTMTVYGVETEDAAWNAFVSGGTLKLIQKLIYLLMVLIYGSSACYIFVRLRRKETGCIISYLPSIYFIGGFIFQFIWESKSRYCYPYYIALFPMAMGGIISASNLYDTKLADRVSRIPVWKKIYAMVTAILMMAVAGSYLKDDTCDFIPFTDYSDTEEMYSTDCMALPKGDYGITLEYDIRKDTELTLYLDHSGEGYPAVMEAGTDSFFFEQHLDEYNDTIYFKYAAEDPEDFVLRKIHIEAGKPLFTDAIFSALFIIILSIYLYRVFLTPVFMSRSKQEKIAIIALHMAVILVSLPLFSTTLFWGADDPAHVMRLEGIKDALLNRQFPVFVFPKNDYGYGLLGYMYPSLFMYIPSVMRIFRVSIPFAMNSLYVAINILTAIIAFFSAREIYEKKTTAYLFTLLYVLLPYRLVNIYTRADVGESLGMCFLPMIFAAMYMCLDEEKRKNTLKTVCYMTLGMTFMINSHVLSTAMTGVLIAVYAIVFIRRLINRDTIKIIAISAVATGLLNIGYLAPFIKLYSFGLNLSDMMHKNFSGKYGIAQLISIHDFSDGSAWGGVAPIGALGIIIFLVGIIMNRKNKTSVRDRFMIVSGILGIMMLIMVSSEFPWDAVLSITAIKKITDVLQFSFRFMMYAAPMITMASAYYLCDRDMAAIVKRPFMAIVALVALISVVPGIIGETKMEPYMTRLSGGASDIVLREYWPAGVTDGLFNDDRLYWSSEDLIFEGYEKNGLRVGFRYNTQPGKDEWIEPPILYYPGFMAVATDAEGRKHDLGVSQGNYYRVRVDLPTGLSGSTVKLYYGGLWYFYIAYAISIISAAIFTFVVIVSVVSGKREKA